MLTLDQQYAIACDPGPGPTGNLKLRQATVGHFMLLSRLESPIVGDFRKMKPGSLALAVWVLSRPWRKSKDSLKFRSTKFWLKLDAARYRESETRYTSDLVHLVNFWRYHTTGLQCWEKEGGSGGGSIPSVFSIQFVLAQLGCSHEEIFSHSLKGAIASMAAYNAMTSKDSPMMDDETMAVIEKRRGLRMQQSKEAQKDG